MQSNAYNVQTFLRWHNIAFDMITIVITLMMIPMRRSKFKPEK